MITLMLLFINIANAQEIKSVLATCPQGVCAYRANDDFGSRLLCTLPSNADLDPSLYKIEITNQHNGLLNKAKALVGLDDRKQWSPGYELEPGEGITCSVDDSKKRAKELLKKAAEDKEKAELQKRSNDWKVACEKGEIHPLICIEKGFKPEDEL